MPKIWEKNLGYNLLRIYSDATVRFSFKSVAIEGMEKVPEDGVVILAPNHCNTLMDALVVLVAHQETVVFGARADIFRKKSAAAVLRWLRILPFTRARDGLRNVADNEYVMDEILDTLENGVKFCMFSEGTHRTKHSLLPIKKGISRIALRADERLRGSGRDVYIVPMGLEYGDYFRFKTTVTVRHGDPINVSEYVRNNPEMLESDIHRNIMAELHDRIASLITYLPDNSNYDADWTLFKISGNKDEEHPEKLRKAALRFEKKRKAAQISFHSLGYEYPVTRIIVKTLFALVSLPVFLLCSVLSLPIWLLSGILKLKVKDQAFVNTVRFGCKFLLLPLLFIIWAVLFFNTMPWYAAVALLLLFCYSNSVHYLYVEFVRVLVSDYRLLFRKDIRMQYESIRKRIKRRKTNS